jgi:hypothetical protein
VPSDAASTASGIPASRASVVKSRIEWAETVGHRPAGKPPTPSRASASRQRASLHEHVAVGVGGLCFPVLFADPNSIARGCCSAVVNSSHSCLTAAGHVGTRKSCLSMMVRRCRTWRHRRDHLPKSADFGASHDYAGLLSHWRFWAHRSVEGRIAC